MTASDDKRDLIIPYIVIGLIVWGALLALGAYVFRGQHDLRKPLIILASVGVFVGFWGIALWINRGRLLRGHQSHGNELTTKAQRHKEE